LISYRSVHGGGRLISKKSLPCFFYKPASRPALSGAIRAGPN
jgi:hypothetical protein